MTGSEIRARFLEYFRRRGHTVVRSSPLVPAQDPTLLFTNAGMVQFKTVFLGEERRDYVRAATAQKCVRAGGKHNDLENVGRTARHNTFFEMLGNFSFGDYFKEEAIRFCWELLTEDFGLPKDRLKATVFTEDDDAFELWKKVAGLGPDRILRLGEKDNFWAMGDTGPCGPCSEVHFHQGDHLPCAEERGGRTCLGPACDCDRWVEMWNLVFMQFNRDASGKMTPLPKPSIDTGMGLERLAAVLQGKQSSFDTDLLRPLIADVEKRCGKAYGRDEEADVSMRVIADHARAATFLIADGVTPSNEWRGYVLRRIMRRAMRHGRMLGLEAPFLRDVTGSVVAVMGDAYPEIRDARARVAETVRQEEERFAETLDLGMAKIREYLDAHRGAARKLVDGRFLFTLYDTHGFPSDLAQEVFQDAGWTVAPETQQDFDAEMEAQRERARAKAFVAQAPGELNRAIEAAAKARRGLSQMGAALQEAVMHARNQLADDGKTMQATYERFDFGRLLVDAQIDDLVALAPSPPPPSTPIPPVAQTDVVGDVDWHKETCRLSAGLVAISSADEAVPASVLRSIAYDVALNCIPPDVAEFQIKHRTELAAQPDVTAEVMRRAEAWVEAVALNIHVGGYDGKVAAAEREFRTYATRLRVAGGEKA